MDWLRRAAREVKKLFTAPEQAIMQRRVEEQVRNDEILARMLQAHEARVEQTGRGDSTEGTLFGLLSSGWPAIVLQGPGNHWTIRVYPRPGASSAEIRAVRQIIESSQGRVIHHTRGASERQIAALPTHEFKKSTVPQESELKCAICLVEYAVGDQMRVLPCLHKMHKKCVDRWLEINQVCPVCRAPIS